MKNMLERWVDLLKPFGFSDRFVRWSFVTAISGLVENRVFMSDMGGGLIYPTLYTLLVGAPATYKTSTCNRVIHDLLKPIANDIEGPFWGASVSTPAALIRALHRNNKKNATNNYLSSPMFVYAGEFNTFYQDIGGGEMTTNLLSMYDPIPPGESWFKDTMKDGVVAVISPALTVLGCTTPKNVTDSKMLIVSGTGIVSRFIFVYEPKRPRGTRRLGPIENVAELNALRNGCIAIRAKRGQFGISDAALELMGDLQELDQKWHYENQSDTLYSHYMARRGTQLRKLSMIFALIARRELVIEKEDVLAAQAMLTEIEPDMPQAFGAQIQFRDAGLFMKLLDRIPPEGIAEGDLFNIFFNDGQAITKSPEYHEAIGSLITLGWVQVMVNKRTQAVSYKRTKERHK